MLTVKLIIINRESNKMKYLFLIFLVLVNILNANETNLTNISLQLQWKHQFESAGFYIAKEKGFYKDVGLELEIKEYNRGVNITEDVINNRSTFGINNSSLLLDKSKGSDIVLLNAILQSSPHALISLKSSNIISLKDFKNKTIMIDENAANTAAFISMLQSKQVSFNDLNVIPQTFNINDLINKKIDISSVFTTNEPYLLNQQGIEYNIWDPKDYGFNLYELLLFTSSIHILNDSKMVENFQKASLKGWEYAFSNINEVVELILEKYNSQNKSRDALIYEATELRKLAYYKTDDLGDIEPHNIQRIFDIYNVLGLTKKTIDLDEFIFNSKSNLFTKKEKEYLKNNKFNVYINNWKPFSSYDNKKDSFTGLSVDFWTKISKFASIDGSLNYVNSFSNLLRNSKDDSNAITLSLSSTKDRVKFGAFSKPYVSFPIAIATNIKEDYLVDLVHLKGKRVAVGKNFSAHKLLNKHYPNIIFVPVENTTEALSLLANEEVYAAADILPALSKYLNEYAYSNLKISGISEFKFDVRMMVNKKNKRLIPILNKAIDAISADDRKLINNKWTTYNKSIEKIDYFLLSIILIPIVIILIFILILYYNQKKYISELEKKEKFIQSQSLKLKKGQKVLSQYVLYTRTDLNGIITDASDAFCRLSGYSRNELLGEPHEIIRQLDRDKDFLSTLREHIKSKKIWTGDMKNLTKDGNYFWVSSTISPEYNDKDNIIGYVSIKSDITAKKEFERQHLQLIEQAKMASLGEMIGNIAHQWRQPLSVISVIASGIKMQKESNMLKDSFFYETMDSIIEQTNYLSSTIDTFKDFIKQEHLKQEIVIQEEIMQALTIMKPTLKSNFIDLIDHINYDSFDVIISNKGELTQVIINLLNNAKDVLVSRSIDSPLISIILKKNHTQVIITIEDNAGGIEENILPHIFEPYFTTKHQSQGTGLGLYMSYQIITESLEGKININNTNKGAMFVITLPLDNNNLLKNELNT